MLLCIFVGTLLLAFLFALMLGFVLMYEVTLFLDQNH